MVRFDRACYEAWNSCQTESRLKLEEAIRDSHGNPESFWKELPILHGEITGLKANQFNLYHDCITRHLGKRRCALKIAKNGALTGWTFEQLDRLVNFQYDRWINAEIKPGLHVAIVMPVGIHFLVTLLTALRIGLKFTFLPLDSPALSTKRIWTYLDQINPDLIMTTSDDAAFINQSSDSVRSKLDKTSLFSGGSREKSWYWLIDYLEEKGEVKEKEMATALSGDVVQIALACQTERIGEVRSVKIQELYFSLMRDGLVILGLKPGVTWAYSSYCSLREQPFCLLASLFYGACTIYFTEQNLQLNSQLLENEPIDVLHISPETKHLMYEAKGFPKHKLKLCTRSIFDHEDERSWDLFKERCKLEKTPFSRVYWDNSQSGVILFSLPSTDKYEVGLWPSMGIPWVLVQCNELREYSLEPFGILKQSNYSDSNLIVTRLQNGCYIGSTVVPTKDGYTLPIDALQQAVSLFEFVDKGILLNLKNLGGAFEAKRVLIIFVKSKHSAEIEKQKKAWTLQLVMHIKEFFGPVFAPDQFEFYPFSPKLEGDNVDRNWCEHQYATGLFARKRRMKVYELLNHLRTLVKEGV